MARIQYQRAAQAGGYRPLQVDERNIARMREESSRQIEGMRQAANAEIQSRRDIAQAMKEDAAYTARAEERNFQIQTQNTQREIAGLQAQAQRDVAQFNADAKATQTIFNSISSFSESASKIVEQIQKAQEEQKNSDERAEIAKNGIGIEEAVKESVNTNLINTASVNINTAVDISNAKGGDQLAGAKVREADPGLNHRLTKNQLHHLSTEVYAQELHRFLQSKREQGGLQTAQEHSQALDEFDKFWFNQEYYKGINPKIYAEGLQWTREHQTKILATARRNETQDTEKRVSEKQVSTIQLSSATDLNQNVLAAFDTLKRIHTPKEALDKVVDALNVRTADGSFKFTVDQAENVQFVYDGKLVTLKAAKFRIYPPQAVYT